MTDAGASAPGALPRPADEVPLRTDGILDRLAALRAADAPTHGGRVLSYVYDPGLAELDELAAAAARAVQPVNGLDPTTFTSVAVMEGELLGFARTMLHGPADGPDAVVGSVTSGGTESCLLAVKIAREAFRAEHPDVRPRVVAPVSVHAAFRKAAQHLDVDLTLVPVDPATGTPAAADLVAALDADDVALAVVSAPACPPGVDGPGGRGAPASARGLRAAAGRLAERGVEAAAERVGRRSGRRPGPRRRGRCRSRDQGVRGQGHRGPPQPITRRTVVTEASVTSVISTVRPGLGAWIICPSPT
ncbi:hypothetical protein [Cellulosimicrobium funkei]